MATIDDLILNMDGADLSSHISIDMLHILIHRMKESNTVSYSIIDMIKHLEQISNSDDNNISKYYETVDSEIAEELKLEQDEEEMINSILQDDFNYHNIIDNNIGEEADADIDANTETDVNFGTNLDNISVDSIDSIDSTSPYQPPIEKHDMPSGSSEPISISTNDRNINSDVNTSTDGRYYAHTDQIIDIKDIGLNDLSSVRFSMGVEVENDYNRTNRKKQGIKLKRNATNKSRHATTTTSTTTTTTATTNGGSANSSSSNVLPSLFAGGMFWGSTMNEHFDNMPPPTPADPAADTKSLFNTSSGLSLSAGKPSLNQASSSNNNMFESFVFPTASASPITASAVINADSPMSISDDIPDQEPNMQNLFPEYNMNYASNTALPIPFNTTPATTSTAPFIPVDATTTAAAADLTSLHMPMGFAFSIGADNKGTGLKAKGKQSLRSASKQSSRQKIGSPTKPNPPAPSSPTIASSSSYNNDNQSLHDTVEMAELYRTKGKEHYQTDDYVKAYDAYSMALKLSPQNWNFRFTVFGNRAATLMMMERYIEAIADCDAAIKGDILLNKLHSRKGRAYLRLGLLQDAFHSFCRVLEYCSNSNSTDTEACKTEAKAELKAIEMIKNTQNRIEYYLTSKDYNSVLTATTDILSSAPHMKSMQVLHMVALNETKQYEVAKAYAEDVTRCHESIQRQHSHIDAVYPPPSHALLQWKSKVGNTNAASVNRNAVVQMLLCMGSEMSAQYIIALKNIDICKTCCADVLDNIVEILDTLHDIVAMQSSISVSGNVWAWVSVELTRVRLLIDSKNKGDRAFNLKYYKECIAFYTAALGADDTAVKCYAVLYSNRAAAYISIMRYDNAIADATEAISTDGTFMRAYVRRARAYSSIRKYTECIRDYRKYLTGTPRPLDYEEVDKELTAALYNQTKRTKENEKRHASRNNSKEYCADSGRPSYANCNGKGYNSSSSSSSRYRDKDFDDLFSRFRSFGYDSNDDSNDDDDADGDDGKRDYYSSSNSKGNYHSNKQSNDKSNSNSNSSKGYRTAVAPAEPTHYTTLGIGADANTTQIRRAYHKLALKYHPDKNKDVGAEDMFKCITSAYSVLIDAGQRRVYDLTQPVASNKSKKW